jgi:hypothetical protein
MHVSLHDCGTRETPFFPEVDKMTTDEVEFAKYAETNDMVLLMPRLMKSDVKGNTPDVSRGCWDVFGQLSKDYTSQN